MANFVLVHGAWHGGWVWRHVVQGLAGAGHRVHAVTLTGLGERAHLLSPAITLETHITDVVNAIEMEEMDQVVLVVHSYAGMLGTAIADRLPGRLRHLVYVDAVVPKPGESWSSTHTSATREARLATAQASPDFSFPPPDPAVYGLTAQNCEWVGRHQTPHPGHTYQATLDFDPGRVAATPRTFVNCTQPALATIDAIRPRLADGRFWDGAWLSGGGVRVVELKTGHDAMISAPAELTRVLLDCA
jgi:pimeloyl-ACP methyl ester carboxylesterase